MCKQTTPLRHLDTVTLFSLDLSLTRPLRLFASRCNCNSILSDVQPFVDDRQLPIYLYNNFHDRTRARIQKSKPHMTKRAA